MDPAIYGQFSAWQNFYVIVGSAAGGLTGLQFVVLALIAQTRAASTMREIRAFGTPTVVHFCTALLVSAFMVAPWRTFANPGVCLGVGGTLGMVYSITTFWHARKATYNPDVEDWIWYTALPFLAHVGLIAAGVGFFLNPGTALWGVAVDALVFLILGIHNSWDTVTYVIVQHAGRSSSV